MTHAYAELAASSNFSFLRGASHPQDLVLRALALGHAGLGLADRNSVAGVVRAHGALKELREIGKMPAARQRHGSGPGEHSWRVHPLAEALGLDTAMLRERARGFKLAVGARLVFADDTPEIIAYPQHRAGWGRLCRLLTTGNLRGGKGECLLYRDDLIADAGGLLLIVMAGRFAPLIAALPQLAEAAPAALWLGATMPRAGRDRRRLATLREIASGARLPLIAVNDVLYADAADRDLQDVLTCIRDGVSIETAGRRLEANAERHLKGAPEMARLFKDAPEAIAETANLLMRVDFDLGQLQYEYPDELVPPGRTAQSHLESLTASCTVIRYPDGTPEKVRKLLREELELIGKLDYARYFLTIYDIVRFAESRGILCQGRGSAANSAVCYVLGITAVDPAENDVLFARFISVERREPPDIDVDFEHERREEAIQHIYDKYGRHRAGIVATVIHYRPRSAIRDVGKALGLSDDITARLADTQWGHWGSDIGPKRIREAGLDADNPLVARAVAFARRLLNFPRHLSQHVGGFVLARGRLDEMVPIGHAAMAKRTFIEWDKDDIDALGLMKVDVLALGMLTCIRKAFDLLREHGGPDLGLADIKADDEKTYAMLQRADSIGVFQVESRAQMNMLPRLRPENFYDLVIQVAIVRPGPIQGNMVHPYLKRRANPELVVFPSPAPPHDPEELHEVLKKTLGVPLFQEQAMKLAMVAARFTAEEANGLRRAMATFRNLGTIGRFKDMMIGRMVARGYAPDFAARCFAQIEGFGSYGFPESHAASFAKLVYISAWLKCHHAAVFACALLNSQPMGFYAPAQIVRNAQENGVEIRPLDINHSFWDNTLERRPDGALALRLGFRQADGLQEADMERLTESRGAGYGALEDVVLRAGASGASLRKLADADAFRSLGLERRAALWAVRRVPDDEPLPLFAAAAARELGAESDAGLPDMALSEHVVADYQTTRLSLKGHPMAFLRAGFRRQGLLTCAGVSASPDGARARVAGVVLVRQRPGNGKAIFITLEDETGVTNVVLWASLFERFRRAVMSARLLEVHGKVQKSPENVVHLMAERVLDRTDALRQLSEPDPMPPQITRIVLPPVDEPAPAHARHPRQVRILPKSRDFH